MVRFILKNLLKACLLVVVVSFVVFCLVDLSPVDPVQANVGQAAYLTMSEAKRAQLEAYWGAGEPLPVRYGRWLAGLLQGDLGMSLRYNEPVTQVIAERAAPSLALLSIAWAGSGILGFVLGVGAGMAERRWPDRIIRGWCFVMTSIPSFWLALILLMVFAVALGWFPIGFAASIGVASADVTWADAIHHLALPAICLTLAGVAPVCLHTREKVVEFEAGDVAGFAKLRGEGPWQRFWRHGLRNVALPALTLQCASIGEIFGGAVLVEEVFSYPGLGQAAVTAGLGSDVCLLAGIAVVTALLVFGGNFAADLLYGVIDPRMREARAAKRAARGGVLGWLVNRPEDYDEPLPDAGEVERGGSA